MAYRFNSGVGGVTCDKCGILYDAFLNYKEYEESYGKSGNDGDICWRCWSGKGKKKRDDVLRAFSDGWRNY